MHYSSLVENCWRESGNVPVRCYLHLIAIWRVRSTDHMISYNPTMWPRGYSLLGALPNLVFKKEEKKGKKGQRRRKKASLPFVTAILPEECPCTGAKWTDGTWVRHQSARVSKHALRAPSLGGGYYTYREPGPRDPRLISLRSRIALPRQ